MPEAYQERVVTDSVIENYQDVVQEEKEHKSSRKKNVFKLLSSNLFSGLGIPSTEFLELMEMREIILLAI